MWRAMTLITFSADWQLAFHQHQTGTEDGITLRFHHLGRSPGWSIRFRLPEWQNYAGGSARALTVVTTPGRAPSGRWAARAALAVTTRSRASLPRNRALVAAERETQAAVNRRPGPGLRSARQGDGVLASAERQHAIQFLHPGTAQREAWRWPVSDCRASDSARRRGMAAQPVAVGEIFDRVERGTNAGLQQLAGFRFRQAPAMRRPGATRARRPRRAPGAIHS